MSDFTVGGTSALFTATEEQFSDKSGLLEELVLKILVDDSTQWGALFSLVTPKDLISTRACRGVAGARPTVVIDIGGGAGLGTLTLDDYAFSGQQALLTDVSSEAPFPTSDTRVGHATFLIVSG